MDEIDEEKLVYKYTVIGGSLGDKLIALSFHLKFVAREEKGCVLTRTASYETVLDAQFDEECVKQIRESMNPVFGKIEQYLLSNPKLYC